MHCLTRLCLECATRHLVGDAWQPIDQTGRGHFRLRLVGEETPHRLVIGLLPRRRVLASDGLGRRRAWFARAEDRCARDDEREHGGWGAEPGVRWGPPPPNGGRGAAPP